MTTDTEPPSPESGHETTDGRFVYQATSAQPPSEAVISAIAARSNADDLTAVADELEPLYGAIDPAALDSLFDSSGSLDRSDGVVTFSYAGYRVTVDATGRVELTPLSS
ncbi:HalOD1 output domain-containing protein [Halopiger djelfimassiliensis]|uniref:HalOD1 output domain-containing protein n=1 Tax=Halopiger djelfimassiliensis TaxID=1293047 RepID=UPI000677A504|nr:HalOD1 output domain-containing protein [Halopiger djelfimassiliensis]